MPFHGPTGEGGIGRFMDGGVFENVPVRLASKIVDERRRREPRCPVRYVVLSSEVTAWDAGASPDDSGAQSLFGVLGEFAPNFLAASRTAELLSFIDEKMDKGPRLRTKSIEPQRYDTLAMPVRRASLSSDHLLAFSGFLDEKFRKLDFYMGMLDAKHFVQTATVTNMTGPEEEARARRGGGRGGARARRVETLPLPESSG